MRTYITIGIVLIAVVAGCTDDHYPRYLTEKELKNVSVGGGHKELDTLMSGTLFLRIRNNNKKFDIYDISVKCTWLKDMSETVLLRGRVSSGMSELLEGPSQYAGVIEKCGVNAAKAGL